jgi:hypothetical protein
MKRQTRNDCNATGKLREQPMQKASSQAEHCKTQALKNKNAKASSQELQCKRKVSRTINARKSNSLAQYCKRKVSSMQKAQISKLTMPWANSPEQQ